MIYLIPDLFRVFVMNYRDLLKSKGLIPSVLAIVTGTGVAFTSQDWGDLGKQISPSQSQRDNYTQPGRTCNSSSNTMWLNYFRSLNTDPSRRGVVKDDDYLASLIKRGYDSTDHGAQTEILKVYGVNSRWDTSGRFEVVEKALSEGYPVVVNILHRGKVGDCGRGALRGGHIVLIRSIFVQNGRKMLNITDPYGQLCANYEQSGLEYNISVDQFKARWQGGSRHFLGMVD